MKALATELEKAMSAEGLSYYRMAGTPESGWIVADYLDFVVHLFTQERRDYYQLERLWSDGKVLP